MRKVTEAARQIVGENSMVFAILDGLARINYGRLSIWMRDQCRQGDRATTAANSVSHEKQDAKLLPMSSPNIDRFLKLFHSTQQKICNKIFIAFPTTPQRRRYTAL